MRLFSFSIMFRHWNRLGIGLTGGPEQLGLQFGIDVPAWTSKATNFDHLLIVVDNQIQMVQLPQGLHQYSAN